MDISKHIDTLLKFNECVIIPDFGGFISNYKPAHYNASNNTYSPPGKELIFNSKINRNDGLLINHLAEVENISYNEASTVILNYVEQSQSKLIKGETLDIANVGKLKLDRSGSYVFQASEQINIDAYGLKEFTYQQSKATMPMPLYQPNSAAMFYRYKGNAIKIAASAAIILALSIAPIKNINQSVQSSALDPVTFILGSQTNLLGNKTERIEPEILEENITQEIPAPYILIGGNFQLLENATTFFTELKEKGHKPEIIELQNGNYRVSIDSYHDYQTALNAMESYRNNQPGSMVWVSKR